MSDYDFKALNDKEFEIFCADLLGDVEGRRFERFKPGKDAGVDGRFFTDDGKEVILQCKHWSNTPLKQLIRELGTVERPKLEKLKPHRYVLAVSNPLSRVDKKNIQQALAPFITSENDIYGNEDLNSLLKERAHIEQRHYKLWLYSASVLGHILNNAILGRSAFSLEEILQSSARYVVTRNHRSALEKLEEHGVVIITGEPGVGKTTLADHLCLHYVAQGFNYVKFADDVREAESIFDPESKQIFYFDDFLGRNYLDALRGHEGSHVTQFIRRVSRNKNKRFVLTSRSTILNQGKLLIDSLEHNNLQRNEYELRIQSLSELDKAQILYNHIWHSGLGDDFIDQLYFEKRYRVIISHRNFNPRLISYITDVTRLETRDARGYWSYIEQSLANPAQIWENPFVAQQDDFSRAIVFLVVLNGQGMGENALAEAYHRFIALPENQSLRGRHEFQSNIRLLTGSFLNRTVFTGRQTMIDLFNPSIGDYVLGRYARDNVALRQGMLSLRSLSSLTTLLSLARNRFLSDADLLSISDALVKHLVDADFDGASLSYISSLCRIITSNRGGSHKVSVALQAAVFFVLSEANGNATDDSFILINWAIGQQIISSTQALDFVRRNTEAIDSDDAIRAAASLLSTIPESTPGYLGELTSVKARVVEVVSENFDEYVEATDAFSEVSYGEYDAAREELEKLIEKKLNDFGMGFDADDVTRISESYDVNDGLDSYYENSSEGDRDYAGGPETTLAIDEVDDLFDRG